MSASPGPNGFSDTKTDVLENTETGFGATGTDTGAQVSATSPSVLTQQLNELKRFAMELANDSFTISPQASPRNSEK